MAATEVIEFLILVFLGFLLRKKYLFGMAVSGFLVQKIIFGMAEFLMGRFLIPCQGFSCVASQSK